MMREGGCGGMAVLRRSRGRCAAVNAHHGHVGKLVVLLFHQKPARRAHGARLALRGIGGHGQV